MNHSPDQPNNAFEQIHKIDDAILYGLIRNMLKGTQHEDKDIPLYVIRKVAERYTYRFDGDNFVLVERPAHEIETP